MILSNRIFLKQDPGIDHRFSKLQQVDCSLGMVPVPAWKWGANGADHPIVIWMGQTQEEEERVITLGTGWFGEGGYSTWGGKTNHSNIS